jgi:phosphohistidine phosphatase
MTLTLILIRHAKSDWDDPRLTDHQRPLNDRGRRAAPRVGAWLTVTGLNPQEALVSDAMRTRETWSYIASQLPDAPAPALLPGLYLAGPTAMLTYLHAATANCVAMVAHNPGTGVLAERLAATPPAHPSFASYPTGAVTVLDFDISEWADAQPGMSRVRAFVIPRDLPDPA